MYCYVHTYIRWGSIASGPDQIKLPSEDGEAGECILTIQRMPFVLKG